MSWSSLFAFSNPTGEVGKTFSATISALNSTLVANGVQNLATFPSLPVGVYAISIDVPLVTNATTGTNLVLSNWEIGQAPSAVSAVVLPAGSIVSLQTTYTPPGAVVSSTANMNFIISVTTAGSVYINSSASLATNVFLTFSATYTTTATCIATKLA